ncbi:TPA: hypothetical protein ACXNIK_002977 [Pseudomonas aeruginosa]
MMNERGRHWLAVIPDATRSGFLSQCSYLAPSPQRRSLAKPAEVELDPRTVWTFDHRAAFTRSLTPELFCLRDGRDAVAAWQKGRAASPLFRDSAVGYQIFPGAFSELSGL